jgi:hypothetical protein
MKRLVVEYGEGVVGEMVRAFNVMKKGIWFWARCAETLRTTAMTLRPNPKRKMCMSIANSGQATTRIVWMATKTASRAKACRRVHDK